MQLKKKWTFHIKEIKFRVYYFSLFTLVIFFFSFLYFEQLIYILAIPLWNVKKDFNFHSIYTELTEVYVVAIQSSFSVSFYVSSWLFFYNLWLFIKSGLFFYEKDSVLSIFFLSLFLIILNLFLIHFVILPSVSSFFISYEMVTGSALQIHLEAKIYMYISLALRLIFWFHFIFQLPVIVLVLIWTGIVDGLFSIRKRGFFYFIFMFFSSIISFSDLLSQLFIFFFIFLFFEFFIFIVLFFGCGVLISSLAGGRRAPPPLGRGFSLKTPAVGIEVFRV